MFLVFVIFLLVSAPKGICALCKNIIPRENTDTLPKGGTSLETHTLHLHERWMVDTIVVRAKTDYNREMTTLFGHLLNDSECVCVSSQSIAW